MSYHNVTTGIYWSSDKPFLFALQDGNETGLPLAAGSRITLKLSDTRYCIGFFDGPTNKRIACDQGAIIGDGKSYQCPLCSSRDATFTAKTGIGTSLQASDLLNQRHYVYLALFGNDPTPKVGVARRERYSERIHEQGAWAAITIAETDGTQARTIERHIHQTTQYPETIRLRKKLTRLCNDLSEIQARDTLMDAFCTLQQHDDTFVYAAKNFLYTFNDFAIDRDNLPNTINLIRSIEGGFSISGTLLGVYGKVLVVDCHGNTYAIDDKLIAGYALGAVDTVNNVDIIPQKCSTEPIIIDKQGALF